jgi:hypothetical protein
LGGLEPPFFAKVIYGNKVYFGAWCLLARGDVQEMMIRTSLLSVGLLLMTCSTVLKAHQVASGTHDHVWRPTTYGKDYRPGHSVNGAGGGITIWSPSTLNQYGAGNSVQFARPEPHSAQQANRPTNQSQSNSDQSRSKLASGSVSQSNVPVIKSLAPSRYGKDHKREYGK